jgi:hypothetical protein
VLALRRAVGRGCAADDEASPLDGRGRCGCRPPVADAPDAWARDAGRWVTDGGVNRVGGAAADAADVSGLRRGSRSTRAALIVPGEMPGRLNGANA